VTSQSPPEATKFPTTDYLQAWISIRELVLSGVSWSGRERDHVFLNMGRGEFADVSQVSAADCIGDGRAAAVTDWDGDGRLDLFLKSRTSPRLQFFRNQAETDGNYLSLELVGTSSNHDAIGARAVVELDGAKLSQTVHAGDGYLSQSTKRLHFGLGSARSLRDVTVRWPDGSRSSHTGFAVNRRYRITQGTSAPDELPSRAQVELGSVAAKACQPVSGLRVRVPLIETFPLAPLRIPSFIDAERTVSDLAGRAVLLHLWGTTCAACVRELATLEGERGRLEAAGVRFVPLTTDAALDHAQARAMMDEHGLGAEQGFVDEALSETLRLLFGAILGESESVPLPANLLLDRTGEVVALYLGPLPVDDLLADVKRIDEAGERDPALNPLAEGVRLVPGTRDWKGLAEKLERAGQQELATFYRRVPRMRRKE